MPDDTICKTVHQYNSEPVPDGDMAKLAEIADDCCKVKNYVYQRYSGIASLPKLYPGYTIQNEMTKSGLRETLGLPSVYFYLAMFDALGDIKTQWTRTKSRISELVKKHESFTEEEKHYLRFVLKIPNAYEAVLNQKPTVLQSDIGTQYQFLSGRVDAKKLDGYLRRQTRRHHAKLHTDAAGGFFLSEKAYRYADGGIYIATKQKRKRIFIPLTDNNQYKTRIFIKLYPEQGEIELKVPVNVTIHRHEDYKSQVGLAAGMYTMFTTDGGHKYGEQLGKYQIEYADWLREQTGIYQRNKNENPGREKYSNRKRRYEERLHGYINQELNRFLKEEKPRTVYVAKLPKPQAGGINKKINNSVTLWQRGYIRKRLEQKCMEHSVEIKEVLGKDISRECSVCGAIGWKQDKIFHCNVCGYEADEKTNTARNAKKRGLGSSHLSS